MKKLTLTAIAIAIFTATSWPVVASAQHVVPTSTHESGLNGEIKVGTAPVGSGNYTGKETKGVAGAVNRARKENIKETADKQREAIKNQQKNAGGKSQHTSGSK